jgi:predicted ArsR family transcriptional regulator
MTRDDLAEHVAGVAALGDPVRRDLYLYVSAQPAPVSRDQASDALGIARHTAKFHLDKLAEEGLLDISFKRLSERRGPGAGRPTKLYRRTARDIAVSLPERRYDLAGQVLAEAVTVAARDRRPLPDTLRAAARNAGRRMAETGERGPAAEPRRTVGDVLARHGYEPRFTGDGIVLANCPFHSLARDYTELVCGMNLDLIDGVLERVCPGRMTAHLDPGPDRCCVTISEPANR